MSGGGPEEPASVASGVETPGMGSGMGSGRGRRLLPRSLTVRLALLVGLWSAAGLGLTWWFVSNVVAQQIEDVADARLATLLDMVAGAASVDAAGHAVLARRLETDDFEQPFSGSYWQIDTPAGSTTSRSLWDQQLPATGMLQAAPVSPPAVDRGSADRATGASTDRSSGRSTDRSTGRSNGAGRSRGRAVEQEDDAAVTTGLLRDSIPGPRHETLRRMARRVELPDNPTPLVVQVATAQGQVEMQIAHLRRLLGLAFGGIGIGLLLGVSALVVVGLAPLRRAGRALAEVRRGERENLGISGMPSEIVPLAAEIEALVAQNRQTVERARSHLGNLAHALKTPIAVLGNALATTPPDAATARAQAEAMERLVQHHLARARGAALAGSAALRTAPVAVAQDLAGALRRLHAARGITLDVVGDAALRVPVDRQDLTEMLGNLMDNACQWAATRVRVSVSCEDGPPLITSPASPSRAGAQQARAGAQQVRILVEDDGTGLTPEERHEVLGRGVRLDEARPGSGLGLAITADLAVLHDGRLVLEDGEGAGRLGGLAASLNLPRG